MKNVIITVHFTAEDHVDPAELARNVERGLDFLVTYDDQSLIGVTGYGAEVEGVDFHEDD